MNTVLHPVDHCVPVPINNKGYKIEVEIYQSANKVETISAYTFHPDRTTFWVSILNWVYEFFFGKTVVLVRVEGESQPLYVRIDDLSRKLLISPRVIRNQVVGNDATHFLCYHQIKRTIEKVKSLSESSSVWTDLEVESLKEVIDRIGYQKIFKVIDHNQFKSSSMANTLVEIGRELKKGYSDSSSQTIYKFQISLPDILVWRADKYKKFQINLANLEFKTEDKPKPAISKDHTPSTILNKVVTVLQSDEYGKKVGKKEFEAIVKTFGISKKDLSHLKALSDRVGYTNLVLVLGWLEENEKPIMINTFIEIGKKFTIPAILDGIMANFRLQYVGRQKVGMQRKTYAFAIKKKNIFVCKEKLNEGNFNSVSKVIKLNNLEDSFIRKKIKKKRNDKQDVLSQVEINEAVTALREEAKFLVKLHKNKKEKGCSYLVVPYACEIVNKDNKTIFIQKEYPLQGIQLKGASLFHQVNAFRDFAYGLAFIHSLGYVHMDVKPANFLLEGDLTSILMPVQGRICDFGLTVERGSFLPGGTMVYLPYEAFDHGFPHFSQNCLATERIDSFALGVSLLEILVDLPDTCLLGLLKQNELDEEINDYRQKLVNSFPKKEVATKLSLLKIIESLLKFDPTQRMSCLDAGELLNELALTLN